MVCYASFHRWSHAQSLVNPAKIVVHKVNRNHVLVVLEDGRRLLTQSDFMIALGRARQAKGREYYDGDVNLPAFLTAKNLKPFIDSELEVTSSQIVFKPLKGNKAFGYPAELLPKVCEVFLQARDEGVLAHTQIHIAKQADILMRALARVGITALVDEATGYQDVRDRLALRWFLLELWFGHAR